MRIGELVRRSGLSRDTIRFYEREGLIESLPSSSRANNYRDYPEELVERLRMITEARTVGFSIPDLQRLFHHLENLQGDPSAAERFLEEKAAELRSIITRSEGLLTMLEETRAALRAACGARGARRATRASRAERG